MIDLYNRAWRRRTFYDSSIGNEDSSIGDKGKLEGDWFEGMNKATSHNDHIMIT